MRHIAKIFSLITLFLFLSGCGYSIQSEGRADAKEAGAIRSAWLAYWELEAGEKELKRLEKKLDKLIYFGAYFDQFGRIFVPKELSSKKDELSKSNSKYETYLSIINDKQNLDGTLILKDLEILRRIFADEAAIERHADEVVSLVLQGQYEGVELDYEKVWKDEKIAKSYVTFIHKLYAAAKKNNLKLRVILEPGTPFASVSFPQGPEYVVMLYNLYGLHSDAGPKANKDFIEKVIKRMNALPGEKAVAFSTGGCLWGDNGKKRFINETEAKTLALTNGSEVRRDNESRCNVFEYREGGMSYQVWYADAETLNYWISVAKQQGVSNISLWRLGGNIDINKIK